MLNAVPIWFGRSCRLPAVWQANAWPFSLHVLVPAVQATVVPDVGHWIMLDAPARFVAALEAAVAGT